MIKEIKKIKKTPTFPYIKYMQTFYSIHNLPFSSSHCYPIQTSTIPPSQVTSYNISLFLIPKSYILHKSFSLFVYTSFHRTTFLKFEFWTCTWLWRVAPCGGCGWSGNPLPTTRSRQMALLLSSNLALGFPGPTTSWLLFLTTGTSWLCFPSYAVITALGSCDARSTCFLTLHPALVHL